MTLSFEVTHYRLQLGKRDSVTGWYIKFWAESTVDMVIASRAASSLILPAGVYVRLDALGMTQDPMYEGDVIKTSAGKYFEVKTVREHYLGDSFWFRECDLTLLPFFTVQGETYTESTVQDARYRTKAFLEGYLNGAALPVFIVAYGTPDYPLTQVFKTKGVDVVFSIGEPQSTPLAGHNETPYGYEEHVPIGVLAVDKENLSGTKAKWQAETELRRITETYYAGSLRSFEKRRDTTEVLGSTTLYGSEFMLDYRRGTT